MEIEDSLKEAAIQAWLDLVYGGQDAREYHNSMRIIRQALDSVPENIRYRPTTIY